MTIHLLTSVVGSPGVTTTAIAWATTAERPTLLVEAAMEGGSAVLAGPFRGELAPERTIMTWAGHQGSEMAEQLWWHTQVLPGSNDQRVLPTIASPEQARGLDGMWPTIAEAIARAAADTGTDVLIDYGRLGGQHAARPLLDIADTILVLTPGTMAGVNATKRTVDILHREIGATGAPQRLAVVPVLPDATARTRPAGAKARPWTRAELAATFAPVSLLDPILYAPDAASVHSAGLAAPTGWWARSISRTGAAQRGYQRSVTRLADAAENRSRSVLDFAGRGGH